MAEERFPCRRPPSMLATRSDSVMLRPEAISFRPFQKASSRLTLVLCPAITIERLTTGDFIDRPPFRCDAHPVRDAPSWPAPPRAYARPSSGRGRGGFPRLVFGPGAGSPPGGPSAD